MHLEIFQTVGGWETFVCCYFITYLLLYDLIRVEQIQNVPCTYEVELMKYLVYQKKNFKIIFKRSLIHAKGKPYISLKYFVFYFKEWWNFSLNENTTVLNLLHYSFFKYNPWSHIIEKLIFILVKCVKNQIRTTFFIVSLNLVVKLIVENQT